MEESKLTKVIVKGVNINYGVSMKVASMLVALFVIAFLVSSVPIEAPLLRADLNQPLWKDPFIVLVYHAPDRTLIQLTSRRKERRTEQQRMKEIITGWAKQFDHLNFDLFMIEVCRKESNLDFYVRGIDTAAIKKSRWRRTRSDYSYGLCQLKIQTARWVWQNLVPEEHRRNDIEWWNLIDPVFNSKTASLYMDYLYRKFRRWDRTLAAYNMGPTHRYLRGSKAIEKGSYAETILKRFRREVIRRDKILAKAHRNYKGITLITSIATSKLNIE
ncbi:MAG TPA: lytic transglycosylase domain-containing protein [bacterium]|nr:lytic transglycosylase domain-containing protein [bacterium]